MRTDNVFKRTIKDSVFTNLFSDLKNLIQLYRTLHPEDAETSEQDLEYITLENVLVNNFYNDLGFLANDRLMILVEAQSTWSPNIVMRGLIYLALSYKEYFWNKRLNLYGNSKIYVPKPELYVVYSGKQGDYPEMMSLKDIYFPGVDCDLDFKARVIYLDESDSIINQYIKFCIVLNQQVKLYGRTRQAIRNAIRICKDENTLREYLSDKEKEVEDIMVSLFDQDWITEVYGEECRAEGREEGLTKGRAEGREEGAKNEKIASARNFIKDGILTIENIKATGRYTPQEIEAIMAP